MQTEPSKAEPPKRKRRWFQFSLRTLMIGTVVVAVIAGWLGRGIEHNRRESEVAKAVTSIGGTIFYDYERWGGGWSRGPKPNGPGWLRAILGENCFSEVTFVGLSDTIVTDADLPAIEQNMSHLAHLKMLDVTRTKISAAGVKHLKAALPNCQVLTDR
jgi:hypothetical protein